MRYIWKNELISLAYKELLQINKEKTHQENGKGYKQTVKRKGHSNVQLHL